MKILIFCSANIGVGSGSEVRARLIAEGLLHHGADIGVVTPDVPDYFSHLGITHYALGSQSSWKDTVLQAAKQFQPDVIYGITEAGTDAVMHAAKIINCRVAYDLHGIGVVEILELGWGHGSQLVRTMKSLQWLSYVPKADIVTVANPTLVPIIKWLNHRAVPIIGMADLSKFVATGPAVKLGTDSTKTQIVYAGNFFKWQGVHLLMGAIRELLANNEPFEFTLIGSVGRTKRFLRRWRDEFADDRVHLLDSVDFTKIANYYRGADALVIPRPFMLSTYLALPQKITEYMGSGKTVIATNLAPHRWALTNPACGILCNPTSGGIADGIRHSRNPELRRQLGQRAQTKVVNEFCHIKLCQRIYNEFANCLENK